jgi:hypothetical protein
MNAGEKLISLSSLNACATTESHLCSIAKGFATLAPVFGQVQNINQLSGEASKIFLLEGTVTKINQIIGEVQPLDTLGGTLQIQTSLKGE